MLTSHTLPLFLHLSVPPSELYQMSVPESAQAGSVVGRIQAKDCDERGNAEITYRIINGDGGAMTPPTCLASSP